MADASRGSSTPCTASPRIRKATSSPQKLIAASASRNLFTREWRRSPKKSKASSGPPRANSERAGFILIGAAMHKSIFTLLAIVFALSITNKFPAQRQSPQSLAPHQPRGTATDVSSAEIQSLVQKTAADRISEQAIRVVSINGEYNLGVGVVHRAKTSGAQAGGGIEHSQITEIYHVMEGNATLVTGGSMRSEERRVGKECRSRWSR